MSNELTHKHLLEIMNYDPDTGVFSWVGKPPKHSSKIAGSSAHSGYRKICIDSKRYYAHRLAWFFVHGMWPSKYIDHINGDCSDNRISNLREATHAENLRNTGPQRNSVSGIKGVYLHQPNVWRARISVGKRAIHLGIFSDKEKAEVAYRVAAKKYHGAFARTGRQ